MSAPVDDAYAALLALVGPALVGAGFIADLSGLKDEPEGAWEPEGDEDGVRTAAALFPLQAGMVRELMGGGVRRWVVELDVRLELAAVGPVPTGEDSHRVRLRAARNAVAVLPATDPTVSGTCEKFVIGTAEWDDLPPSGLKLLIPATLRFRAGDPLGTTQP